MQSKAAPQLDRLDRYVARSYVRMIEGASRARIAYSLEEALRLANLPGEVEGRIYCFRRVSLSGIAATANRRVWTEQVQQVLAAVAAQAIHGADPNVGASNAIFFNNLEEALEMLLRNALRRRGTEWAKPEWFSTSVLGAADETSYSQQIPAILERLRQPAIAPGAAAAILFAALGNADPAALLSAIPSHTIRGWVHELEGSKGLASNAPPVPLPSQMKTALQKAATYFGSKDPATVWLAAQAVICLSPAASSSGTAVKRARSTLLLLEAEQRRDPVDRDAPISRPATSRPLVFDDDESDAKRKVPSADAAAGLGTQTPRQLSEDALDSATPSSDDSPALQGLLNENAPAPVVPSEHTAQAQTLLGEATQAAGLCFLLNVLRRLGIAGALDACPALAEIGLVIEIMKGLAVGARVADSDPILSCLDKEQSAFALPAEVLANPSLKIWPQGLAISHRTIFDSEYFLHAWVVAVKLLCWRAGRITVRDIVTRNGQVWRTRTDLDVTLPLAEADIRIRRIGLDIDLGWLPWFGQFGCVVRFHYRDREPG